MGAGGNKEAPVDERFPRGKRRGRRSESPPGGTRPQYQGGRSRLMRA